MVGPRAGGRLWRRRRRHRRDLTGVDVTADGGGSGHPIGEPSRSGEGDQLLITDALGGAGLAALRLHGQRGQRGVAGGMLMHHVDELGHHVARPRRMSPRPWHQSLHERLRRRRGPCCRNAAFARTAIFARTAAFAPEVAAGASPPLEDIGAGTVGAGEGSGRIAGLCLLRHATTITTAAAAAGTTTLATSRLLVDCCAALGHCLLGRPACTLHLLGARRGPRVLRFDATLGGVCRGAHRA